MTEDVLLNHRNKLNGNPEEIARSLTAEALSEVILDRRNDGNKEPPTSTEYFAAILTGLQGQPGPQQISLMYLLSVVIASVPVAVIRLKGEACLHVVFGALKGDSSSDDDARLVRHGLTVVGLILGMQEATKTTWDRASYNQGLHVIVSAVADQRPKVRKIAQSACSVVLQAHSACPFPFQMVCDSCIETLSNCSLNECQRVLRLLSFIHGNTQVLVKHSPNKCINSLTTRLVELVCLGHSQLSCSAFRAIEGLVAHRMEGRGSEDSKKKSVVELVESLCKLIINVQRYIVNDVKVCTSWITCLQKAELQLVGDSRLPQVTEALVHLFVVNSDSSVAATSQPQMIVAVGTLSNLYKDKLPSLDLMTTESVMSHLESLLSPQYEESWPLTLELLRVYFSAASPDQSSPMLDMKEDSVVKQLVAIREAVINPVTGTDKPKLIIRWRSAVHRVISSAIAYMGIDRYLQLIPFAVPGDSGVSPIRTWMLPILRESVSKCHDTSLEFFRKAILSSAQECEELATAEGLGANSSKMLLNRAIQLWMLLPGMCVQTIDISSPSGFRALVPVLGQALEDSRYPELVECVCTSIQHLIVQVSQEGRTEDKETISSFARIFLPAFFNLYDSLITQGLTEKAVLIHTVIASYSELADPELVNTLFRQVSQHLVMANTSSSKTGPKKKASNGNDSKVQESDDSDDEEASSDDDDDLMDLGATEMDEQKRKTHILCSLVLALVPVLSKENVSLLFRVILPFLDADDDDILQKRGYRVLECICETQIDWVREKQDQLVMLLQSSFFNASASCKTARLKCLSKIVVAISESSTVTAFTEIIQNLMGEVILSTKEANNKARSAAFKLLVTIAERMHALYSVEGQNGVKEFLNILVGGLAAQTQHMRSASVVALCRIFSQFGKDPELQDSFVEVAQTTLILLNEKSREVAKSCIGFAKVCAVRLPVATVLILLPDLLAAILPWANDTKNRFALKIRVILERLTKRIGSESILACNVIPSDHKLLTYIRKQSAYKKRRYEKGASGRQEEEVEEDEDDLAPGYGQNKHSKKKRSGGHAEEEDIIMDEGGEALDLLGASALGRIKRHSKATTNDINDFKMTRDGRMIIPEDEEDDDEAFTKRKRNKMIGDVESDDEDDEGKAYGGRGKKIAPPTAAPVAKKKAGGDVRKKGNKMEPFTYIELNPKFLNKRRKHESSRQFRGIGGKNFQNKKKKK